MKWLFFSIILLFLSCNQPKTTITQEDTSENNVFKSNFRPIIEGFIDSLESEQIEANIIAVICYSIFDKEYIQLVTVNGYNPKFMIGYTVYKDFLIFYSGVEDSIANKIFKMEFLSRNMPDEKYMNVNNIDYNIIFDPIGVFYTIDVEDSIKTYKPSSTFKEEVYRLEVKYGFSPPIPPEPR